MCVCVIVIMRQGCIISPWLFDISIDVYMRKMKTEADDVSKLRLCGVGERSERVLKGRSVTKALKRVTKGRNVSMTVNRDLWSSILLPVLTFGS